jgi:hypothetical protein
MNTTFSTASVALCFYENNKQAHRRTGNRPHPQTHCTVENEMLALMILVSVIASFALEMVLGGYSLED